MKIIEYLLRLIKSIQHKKHLDNKADYSWINHYRRTLKNYE